MIESRALSNRQIIRATLIVLSGFLASGLLGLIREGVVAAQFGATEASDAFAAAQRIPEFVFVIISGGALGSSFIPVYARLREENEEKAWQLASAVMTLAAIVSAIVCIFVALLAPSIASALLSNNTPEKQDLAANLIRIMMITPFIFSIGGLIVAILQSHQLFLLPSIAISMNSIGIIIGALLFAPLLSVPSAGSSDIAQVNGANVYGLALGAVLSSVLYLGVQVPGLRQIHARLRLLPSWRVEGVIEVLTLMGPRVLGLSIVQINFIVNIILTSPMLDGSLTALRTAFTIMFFAIGVIAQSVGSAVFPSLAALSAEGDIDGFKNRLSNALRNVLFLSFPATVGFIIFGDNIVGILERGAWTPQATAATAWALVFYAVGIVGFSILEVMSRAFYALSDTWTPVIIGTIAMIANIVLSITFVQFIGDPNDLAHGPFAGLALANSLTTLLEAAVLWGIMRRRIGNHGAIRGLSDGYILIGLFKALLATGIMGMVLLLIRPMIEQFNNFIVVTTAGFIGLIVFFGIASILGLQEARSVLAIVYRRLAR